jgi:hypothetical protein
LDKQTAAESVLGQRTWNFFYSPMFAYTKTESVFNALGEFECSLQIGSKLFPEYPIRSHSEAFYQLKKSIGIQASPLHSIDINKHEYQNNKLIIGLDLEKVLDAGWTGINTRAGDLLTIKFKHMDTSINANANYATALHTVLVSDNILKLSDTGVEVYG